MGVPLPGLPRDPGVDDRRAELAVANAARLVELERGLGLFHESTLQRLVGSAVDVLSAYYMIGFAPLIVAVLVWLGLCDRDRYRELRTLLFVSLAIAVVFYVLYPTAPPRLVPSLGITDTVGLAGQTPARSRASASTPMRRCRACTSAGACSSAWSAIGRSHAEPCAASFSSIRS